MPQPITAPVMHWWRRQRRGSPNIGNEVPVNGPETLRFLLGMRLFLDPDAILAVARWGALIVKWT